MIVFRQIQIKDYIQRYSSIPPTIDELERYRSEVGEYFKNVFCGSDEEFQKNEINRLLCNVYGYRANTKEKVDSAIYVNGEAQVLIEAKAFDKKGEFPKSKNDLVSKALAQAILYFLRETQENDNNSIRHIILCNPCEFYLFDAKNFLIFSDDKTILKAYKNCEKKKGLVVKNNKFYDDVKKYLKSGFEGELPFVYFSLRNDLKNQELSQIYQLLSPSVLLKERKNFDCNTLNKEFYNELLYILGLQEISGGGGGKVLIRVSEVENTLSNSILSAFNGIDEESVFSLLITWNNRILFLRLLESMLLNFKHIKQPFLDCSVIKDFKTLQTLFFDVLAKTPDNRRQSLPQSFLEIPYLNSSLFDRTPLELSGKEIGLLDSCHLPLFSRSILKKSEDFKDKKSLPLLEYLFEFLHSYKFTTTSKDVVDNIDTSWDILISSSVLGLVFEKLNGYKEGSFYTPSFITSNMCSQSIALSVLEKFNSTYQWECKNLRELKEQMGFNHFLERREEYLDKLLSLKICDPSVGSGHFLVSALNEMIKIAYDLGLVPSLYEANLEIKSDEIILRVQGEVHQYVKFPFNNPISHKIQSGMFELKKKVIENCLFGVDINPISCEITKLRLWIELLKYSYYQLDENSKPTDSLVTLPNIDINIKSGNSLISYFDTKDSLSHIKDIKSQIAKYKELVKLYKEGIYESKTILDEQISQLHKSFMRSCFSSKFTREIKSFDEQCNRYSQSYGDYLVKDDELLCKFVHRSLFDLSFDESEAKRDFLALRESYKKIFSLEDNKPFEWRFAFPEVLDEEGNFLGFDCLLANPPYVVVNKKNYPSYKWNMDLYMMFFELAFKLTKRNGYIHYIVPRFWLVNKDCKGMRDFMLNHIDLISLTESNPFEMAVTENVITLIKNSEPQSECFEHWKERDEIFTYIKNVDKEVFKSNQNNEIVLSYTPEILKVLNKINQSSISLGNVSKSKRGVEFGKDFVKNNSQKGNKKILMGYEVRPYCLEWQETYIDIELPNVKRMADFFDCEYMIYLRRVDNRLTATISNEKYAFIKNLYGIECFSQTHHKLILALLNSKMMNFYYLAKFTTKKEKVFPEIQSYLFNQLPIKTITKENEGVVEEIIGLVDRILQIKQKDFEANIQEFEEQIDTLVYALYELDQEDIKIIEKEKE